MIGIGIWKCSGKIVLREYNWDRVERDRDVSL